MKLILVFGILTFLGLSAQAEGLLGDSCVGLSSQNYAAIHSAVRDPGFEILEFSSFTSASVNSLPLGLTCEDLKDAEEIRQIISMALTPAAAAMASPLVRSALAAELATIGVVAGTPVVLGVTIIGGFGVMTIKILLKRSMEDCARQEKEALKQQLLQELDARYGLTHTNQTTLQISR
jgi:hypothetical protein